MSSSLGGARYPTALQSLSKLIDCGKLMKSSLFVFLQLPGTLEVGAAKLHKSSKLPEQSSLRSCCIYGSPTMTVVSTQGFIPAPLKDISISPRQRTCQGSCKGDAIQVLGVNGFALSSTLATTGIELAYIPINARLCYLYWQTLRIGQAEEAEGPSRPKRLEHSFLSRRSMESHDLNLL